MTSITKWGIYLVNLDPVLGSEQSGQRPALVISNDDFNAVMQVVTVIPITSLKPGRHIYPSEVLIKKGIANLKADSLLLSHQIRTISKKRILEFIGKLPENEIHTAIIEAIKLHMNL